MKKEVNSKCFVCKGGGEDKKHQWESKISDIISEKNIVSNKIYYEKIKVMIKIICERLKISESTVKKCLDILDKMMITSKLNEKKSPILIAGAITYVGCIISSDERSQSKISDITGASLSQLSKNVGYIAEDVLKFSRIRS